MRRPGPAPLFLFAGLAWQAAVMAWWLALSVRLAVELRLPAFQLLALGAVLEISLLVAEVPTGTMLRFDVVAGATAAPSSFLVTNAAGRPAAFRNACVHQGRPLDGGRVEGDGIDGLVLVCPWHGFRYDAATGDCLSSPGSRLDAVACTVHRDHIWLRATNG